MNTKLLQYSLCLLVFAYMMGCDDYEQKVIVKNIYVDRASLTPFVGESIQLTASPTDGTFQYQWSSEDPAVATVTTNGLVEVISEGITHIVVSFGDIETKVPLVAVIRIPLEDVMMNESTLLLRLGDEKKVVPTFVPENANDIPLYSWSSESPDIASVGENGEVTAENIGNTYIVYRIGDIVKKIEVKVF